MSLLLSAAGREKLAATYGGALLDDVMPFWLRHGMDPVHGGILTSLNRDGSLMDSDKSLWFQGRAGWMWATLYHSVEARPEWLEAARSCVDFSRRHGHGPGGKMWFTVTREGQPLRMRRYVYSESFAAISYAAYARVGGDSAGEAWAALEMYLRHSFEPGVMPPKFESTRPTKGLAPLMIGMVTAQELRAALGDEVVLGKSLSEWIGEWIGEIERDFFKREHAALMEVVGLDGGMMDHAEGRTLNPGHAMECAWFIMEEGRQRGNQEYIRLGLAILDGMWERGWDREHGGILYFADVRGLPVQEYWQDMKFWWPHCEAVIATLLAWKLTGEERYAAMHQQVHEWSFGHFPDPEHGEWYGYLHRDGSVAQPAKGNQFKGPFHLPRMLWFCGRELGGFAAPG